MPNPAVVFKESGPPTGADSGPLPTVKVDLTPPPGRKWGEEGLPGQEAPQEGLPEGQNGRQRPPVAPKPRMLDDLKRYRRKAWEEGQRAQELEGRLAQAEARADWARRFEEASESEKVRMASAKGLTYDTYTQAILKGEKPLDPVQEEVLKTKEELASLREELNEERKEAATATFKASIQRHVVSNSNRYPWIRRYADMGSMDEVFDVCRLAYERFGEHVSIKRASRMVEGYLDKLANRTRGYFEAEPARSNGQGRPAARPTGEYAASRVPARGNGAPEGSRNGMSTGRGGGRPPFTGLSNRMTPSAATFDRARPARNDSEREARALAILRGQLAP